ncbi:MAG TPA: 50S ribosomal protein L25, partial [Flavobacteriales bacterium]|nr:50S ribosomal protein L25 [Flavobacteriales bacterium]
MKTASLSGSPREGVGKKGASGLRAKGLVPGVLYGGAEQVHFHVNEIQLNKLVFTPETYRLNFEVGGTTYDCIIQDIQFHPVTDRIVHIDLLQIMADKPIRVKLPVRTTGTSEGVRNGGRLHVVYRRLPVSGIADQIPEDVSLDITPLLIGDSLRVSDLTVEGCRVTLNDSAVVLGIRRTRAAMSASAEGE